MLRYDQLLQQHEVVMNQVRRLQARIGHAAGSIDHTRARAQIMHELRLLQRAIADHFAAEEDGGYLASTLAVRPDLHARIRRAGAQHGEILERVRATLATGSHRRLDVLRPQVAEILERLRAHEAEERGLVQDAALEDLGVGD